MIWLILVAAVFVVGGAWFIAKSLPTRALVLVLGLAAVGAYWAIGRPGMPDDPLTARVEQLEAREKSAPGQLTPDERLAVLQERSVNAPSDPEPMREIGDLYASVGRLEDAEHAYRAALLRRPDDARTLESISSLEFQVSGVVDQATRDRLPQLKERARTSPETLTAVQLVALLEDRIQTAPKDPTAYKILGDVLGRVGHFDKSAAALKSAFDLDPKDIEVVTTLADARFKATNQVDPFTTELYEQAFKAQPDRFRLGYLAGIGLWLQGRKAEAEKIWAGIDARAPKDGPERQMFAALRQMFGIDPAPAVPPAPPSPPPG